MSHGPHALALRRLAWPLRLVRAISEHAITVITAPPAVVVVVASPGPPVTVAGTNCVALRYPAVEIDMQMKAFPAAAGIDPEVWRFPLQEANAVITPLLELEAYLVGIMRAGGGCQQG